MSKLHKHRPMPKTNNLTSSITSSRTLLSKVSHPVTKTTSQSSKKSASCPISIFHPRDHLELGEMLGAIDMERGAKVSGSRFYFLKGVGAQLEMALTQMGMDQATEAGFTPIITPTLVRPEVMNGTGFNVEHDDEIYRIEKDDLYLVGTSEVALAGYYADEI